MALNVLGLSTVIYLKRNETYFTDKAITTVLNWPDKHDTDTFLEGNVQVFMKKYFQIIKELIDSVNSKEYIDKRICTRNLKEPPPM